MRNVFSYCAQLILDNENIIEQYRITQFKSDLSLSHFGFNNAPWGAVIFFYQAALL